VTSTKTALRLTHKNDCDLDHMTIFFLKTNIIQVTDSPLKLPNSCHGCWWIFFSL